MPAEWDVAQGRARPARRVAGSGARGRLRAGDARSARAACRPPLIAGNPEFLRPLVGVAPAGGAHLRFYAVDVGRSADGRWWVLGDRTQAPSGAGYALEKPARARRARCPDIYRALRVERLAPFFQAFQARARRASTARTIRASACSRPGR